MRIVHTAVAVLVAGLLLVAPAQAQLDADVAGALNIVDAKPVVPSVNTALIFTNPKNAPARVKMVAYNYEGTRVGEHELAVPALGLKYVFVSQFVDATALPFVGWVEAKASPAVFPSAVLLGVGTTALPANNRRTGRMFFRLTAAY